MADYAEFLASKRISAQPVGFEPGALHWLLFPFQRDITRWAVRRGRAAAFTDCGTGKTLMQLEWAREVMEHEQGPHPNDTPAVLILAPLAVAEQTQLEGERFGIPVKVCESMADVDPFYVNVTNYEKLHKFDPAPFCGIVLDESSILKSFDGSTRKAITEFSRNIPYRLACTATPSPNDYTELGNHAEFLGIMSMAEMLATFFVHDGGETSKWRLKGHAVRAFHEWLSTWAVYMRKPSDLGYADEGFDLPPMTIHEHVMDCGPAEGFLFPMEAKSLHERRAARRSSLDARVHACAEMVNASQEQWLIWCGLNDESAALKKAIPTAVEVRGSDTEAHRRDAMLGFQSGKYRDLVSKASICGWGLNQQHCSHMAFVGLSDSWEEFYQAVRRIFRFGQKNPVEVHIFLAEIELPVLRNIKRKEADANWMAENMMDHMRDFSRREITGQAVREREEYATATVEGKNWTAHLGDCVEVIKAMPADHVHYIAYSPPFSSLYTYSNSERDMGNCRSWEEFTEHYRYIVGELYRVLKPGRLLSFHCMLLPTTKQFHGSIGVHDFRGDLIRIHEKAGFVFHSEVCIWKDPVTAMQRTKALGLLHKQVVKDSAMSRQGLPDYFVTMRKPGTNDTPVSGELQYYAGDQSDEDFTRWCRKKYEEQKRETDRPMSFDTFKSIQIWQRYASPVWMDIDPSNTLQRESAREEKDERHIAPLQLQVVERGIQLWTMPGDVVLSPFGGIGSEGYQAVKMGRKAIVCELKRSYWEQAVKNLKRAEAEVHRQGDLFEEKPDSAPEWVDEIQGEIPDEEFPAGNYAEV